MAKNTMDNSSPLMPEAENIQSERAWQLLELSQKVETNQLKFTLEVAALHLARSIPDYWYTIAKLVAQETYSETREANKLTEKLKQELEVIFLRAARYELIDSLRRWDFHWEPLKDSSDFDKDHSYRRGAPMLLSSGPTPNSIAGLIGTNEVFTGSGRRVGRANYYEIRQSRYLDEAASEVLPLGLAVAEFLKSLPECSAAALQIPEIKNYFASPKRFRFP